ncbi:MAG: YdbH domain-containing protein [Deltaproteobacteria bacterium]|jgi:hypothetical protein|nr:YdbH domain-containing protein [Deltaproteobacteria bacterium]
MEQQKVICTLRSLLKMLFKKKVETVFWVFLCLTIVLLVLFINLPNIIESQIEKRVLHFLNPDDIEFDIQHLGFFNTHISKIRIFKSISIDSADIDYDIKDLSSLLSTKAGSNIDFKVEKVTISGLNIQAILDENGLIKIRGLKFSEESKNQSKKKELFFLQYLPRKIVLKNSQIVLHSQNDKFDDDFFIPFDLMSIISADDGQIVVRAKAYPFGETVNCLVTYDINQGIKFIEIQGRSFDIGHFDQFISKQTDRLQLKGEFDFKFESSSPKKRWDLDVSQIALIKPVEVGIKDIKANLIVASSKINAKGSMNIYSNLIPEIGLQYGMIFDRKNNNYFDLKFETGRISEFEISYKSNLITAKNPKLTARFQGVPAKTKGKIVLSLKNTNFKNKKENIVFSDLKLVSDIAAGLNRNGSKLLSKFTLDANNVNFHSSSVDSLFPNANISGEFFLGSDNSPSCSMTLKAYNGKISASKFKTKALGIDIEVPVSYPEPVKKRYGKYSISSISYDNKYSFSTKGKILQTNLKEFNINGNIDFNQLPDIKTKFNSIIGFKNNPEVSLEFQTNSFKFSESDIKKLILTKIPAAEFEVTAFIKGSADYIDHNLKSSMFLTVNDGKFFMPANNLTADGINSVIEFNDLLSFQTVPGQILTINSIENKNIKINDARMRFSMEQGKSFLVENIKFKWCNGLVSTESIRFPQKKGEYSLTLYCDRLELTQLLKQMGVFNAEGMGTLNGRIPVVYSNGNISFDNGFLFSTPGKGGRIMIENSDRITTGIPMDSPQFSQLDLAQEALKDFKYKWAKLKFHTQDDTLFVNMELDGEPSKILPFEYSKEFGGFIRVDASSPGSHFQGIKLDINLKLPFNKVIKSGNKLKSIFK